MIDGVKPLNGSNISRIVAYRNRAEELRTIAVDLIHESERLTLERIAETYDMLANGVAAITEIAP